MEKLREDAYNEGFDDGFASADDWLAQHEDAMAEHGWVRLPLDADGKPVHIGDVMEWPDGKTFEVVGIGDGTLFYIAYENGHADWTGATTKRHYREPTVEDVLREFSNEMTENLALYSGEAIDTDEWVKADEKAIAKYATKLRLAKDGK